MEQTQTLTHERITFEYVPWQYHFSCTRGEPCDEKRQCTVDIFRQQNRAAVVIFEKDNELPTRVKKLNFTDIAFQLRRDGYLSRPWINPRDVKWYKHELRGRKNLIRRVLMYRPFVETKVFFGFVRRIQPGIVYYLN